MPFANPDTGWKPLEFGHLQKVCRPENLCPEGARGLSPGFQPWEAPPERRALKGRQIEGTYNVPIESSCSTFQMTYFILHNNRCEIQIHLLNFSPLQLQGEPYF
jgi:hypothetical protein